MQKVLKKQILPYYGAANGRWEKVANRYWVIVLGVLRGPRTSSMQSFRSSSFFLHLDSWPKLPQYNNPISMGYFSPAPICCTVIWHNLLFQHFLRSFGQLSRLRKEDEDLKLCMDDALSPLSTPNKITQYLWATFSTALFA